MIRYVIHELWWYRLITLCLLLFILCFLSAYFLITFTVGGHLKILLDFALLSYYIFILVFPLFCVIPWINRHEKKLAFFLCKGISRHQYILHIWSGFVSTLALCCIAYFVLSLVVIKLIAGLWLFYLLPGYITLFVEGVFLTSASLFFATVSQQSIAWLATITLFIICYTNHEWITILQHQESMTLYLCWTIGYYLLPDLSLLDIKNSIIYQLPINFGSLLLFSLYITIFSFIFLYRTTMIFNKKLLS